MQSKQHAFAIAFSDAALQKCPKNLVWERGQQLAAGGNVRGSKRGGNGRYKSEAIFIMGASRRRCRRHGPLHQHIRKTDGRIYRKQ